MRKLALRIFEIHFFATRRECVIAVEGETGPLELLKCKQ